ncbi:hypothetical protein [Sphingomonas oryzagri]|uniref:Uncharacterized protein n=1 Tax=Sphingomonas oryzagri TaxID=3042314 RepID=A0ABT6N1X5_9SPHN|nr:hypothetical protein [Sphingomonas oryzagri]MDH7639301.1 hypothetical protein [Sphingomonas oryzagri]
MSGTGDRLELLREIDALEALLGRIAVMAAAPDADQKRALVVLRRALAGHVQQIRLLGEAVHKKPEGSC